MLWEFSSSMKFTAKTTDLGHIESFTRICSTISKLAKSIVVRIVPDHLCFTKQDNAKDGAYRLWCDINASGFFEDFRMEGLSGELNEIYLELESDDFFRAVKSASDAKHLRMKLTRKNVPYLTFELKFPSATSRMVMHDVPVRVVPPRLWKEYAQPTLHFPDSSIFLPPVKVLHKVLNSMKNMLLKHVTLAANNEGHAIVKIESDVVTVSTHFEDLSRPDFDDEEMKVLKLIDPLPDADDDGVYNNNENRRPDKFYSVRIDLKTLSQFLSNQQIIFCRLIANIVNNKCLHVLIVNEEFNLQYFIPAVMY